jgi:hypothetical protein|tara:strand:- start:2060 stop:2317 length:258 start_codon:yes stop_codon:yes gene_type:complete
LLFALNPEGFTDVTGSKEPVDDARPYARCSSLKKYPKGEIQEPEPLPMQDIKSNQMLPTCSLGQTGREGFNPLPGNRPTRKRTGN